MSEIDFTALINGVPLFWFVMALTTLWGKLGLKGNNQLISALVTGTVLGIAYQASVAPLVGWGEWFEAIVYGLSLGLTAIGVYETGKKIGVIASGLSSEAPK